MSLKLEIALEFEIKICKILHFIIDMVFIMHIAMSLNVFKILYVELVIMSEQHHKMNITSPQGRFRFFIQNMEAQLECPSQVALILNVFSL
jgi:hypothetical protein